MSEMALEPTMVIAAPGRLSVGEPAGRDVARGRCSRQTIELEAVDKTSADVGFGELAPDQRGDIAHMAFDRLVDIHLAGDERMVQQVAADLIGAVREIV